MRFNEGDIVKISKKSTYYRPTNRGEGNNPCHIEGKITGIDSYIRVRWDNNTTNTYGERDLGLVRRD